MTIPEIKEQLSILTVLEHYGIKPNRSKMINCPFHPDKTQTAFCFSTNCLTHGKAIDVIDFILYYEKCSKHKAIKKAKSIINPGAVTTQATATTLRQAQGSTNEKALFLERMFTYFKNAVHNSKPAKEYISFRNLDYRKLKIGYNARKSTVLTAPGIPLMKE